MGVADWLKCRCVRILEQIAEILGIHSTFEQAILTEFYIEALLGDQVWEAWDNGEIDDQVASLARWLVGALNASLIYSAGQYL